MSGDPDDCEFFAENNFMRVDANKFIPPVAQAWLEGHDRELREEIETQMFAMAAQDIKDAKARTAEECAQRLDVLAKRWQWAANLGTHTVAEINAQQSGWNQCAEELAELAAAIRSHKG